MLASEILYCYYWDYTLVINEKSFFFLSFFIYLFIFFFFFFLFFFFYFFFARKLFGSQNIVQYCLLKTLRYFPAFSEDFVH